MKCNLRSRIEERKRKRRVKARELYEINKKYAEENIERMSWRECVEFGKTQNDLYLRSIGEK